MLHDLPVRALFERFPAALREGPVVVTSPPGSGKSTLLPIWAEALGDRVWVIEPRRVSCRSLARFVAKERGVALGEEVGYAVRHDGRIGPGTKIAYLTPGVAIRRLEDVGPDDVVFLDEFHERSMQVDLLLAALLRRGHQKLCVLSATLDGAGVAEHIGGVHLEAKGRLYPVDVRFLGEDPVPQRRRLAERVAGALAQITTGEGDVLIFLPGKAEIAECQRALEGGRFEPLPLHGALPASEQDRAFEASPVRRAILSTNVAETSVTLPHVRAVVDSGLVRRTTYRDGRGALALVPIAADSADQRAGRAGRLGPGECLRLWSASGKLQPSTPPEILREELTPLVMWALQLGYQPGELPWLDPPPDHALEAAVGTLERLGVIAGTPPQLTEAGRRIGRLPVDPALGRLLLAGRDEGAGGDAALLVAALAADRSIFTRDGLVPTEGAEIDPLTDERCDVTAIVRALREPRRFSRRLRREVVSTVLRDARQLADLLGEKIPEAGAELSRQALARAVARAFPRSAFARRPRRDAWGNGWVEVTLGRDCLIDVEETRTILVVDQHVVIERGRKSRRIATCAMPAKPALLRELGAGRIQTVGARLEEGRVLAVQSWRIGTTELARDEVEPEGEQVADAVLALLRGGDLFSDPVAAARDEIEAHNVRAAVEGGEGIDFDAWLERRVRELGLEAAADVELLSPGDFAPGLLDEHERAELDRRFPRRLHLGDQEIRVHYDPPRRRITLERERGRASVPRKGYLPSWRGWKIQYSDGKRTLPID